MNEINHRKYDLIIFDVDGTLLNTAAGVLKSAEYAILQSGRNLPDKQTMLSFIGPPIQDSFEKTFKISGNELVNMTNLFRNSYSMQYLYEAEPYAGLYEVLDVLTSYKVHIAIATYKREDYAVKILHHFVLDRYSDSSHGADAENKLKKSDIIEKCIQECGISERSRIVMVGDTEHDASGAKKAGVDFIGVTWGFGFQKKQDVMRAGAIGSADKPAEILNYVLENPV